MSSKISAKDEKGIEESCDAKHAGRPRCPVTHQNILKAARELMDEIGFECLTIEGIAARAGVGKTTIYRRWPNKTSIVLDAFLEAESPKTSVADTGSLREDLQRQMRKLVKELNGPVGRSIATLLASAQFDDEMKEAFRERWIEPRRAEMRRIIQQGMERDQIRKTDPDLLLDALYGPVYFRLLGGHAPLTASFADALTELMLHSLEN